MVILRKTLPLMVLLLLALGTAHAATWTTIDVPNSGGTTVSGINDHGDMVGDYVENGSSVVHGFLLADGIFTKIDVPGATSTLAYSINKANPRQIAGYFVGNGDLQHGFVFDGQNFTILDFPGAEFTNAFGINDARVVVGFYEFASGAAGGFEWTNGKFTTLEAPGAEYTVATGLNNHGHVVGIYLDAENKDHGFVRNPQGKFRTMSHRVTPFGINDNRVIVGVYQQEHHGFKFDPRTKFFSKIDFPGAFATSCDGLNANGQIVGSYQEADGVVHGFLRTK